MDKVTGKLTVFFEEPFWIGVFERVEGEMRFWRSFRRITIG